MKVTIYDVAKKAGVSISTASKALNDRKDVGEKTKEKVKQIAKELSYEPSHFARALAMKKTGNIGVLTVRYYSTPMLTNPFYSKIIEGIEEGLMNSDLNLITNVLRREQIERLELPKMVKEKNIDGLILLGYMPEEFVDLIVNKGLPVVVVDNDVKENISMIVTDDEGGAYNAVNYLIKTGHKKIAYISGPSKRGSFKKRGDGYLKALSDNNIEIRPDFILYNENEEPGYEWMKKILESNDIPDAIFTCNDVTAILCINMLRERGLKVPDDISVIGFDNIEMGQHFIPSLSTVDVDKEKIGIKAVNLLSDKIKNKTKSIERIIFPVNLIIRDSVKQRK
ncbi:MAG: LacI family transcriptional regulator [Candidatus Goldbacteria bacterium]|nr:LacI family transcriptional regulator [Candidatus Goldiibacteriota bacterium]